MVSVPKYTQTKHVIYSPNARVTLTTFITNLLKRRTNHMYTALTLITACSIRDKLTGLNMFCITVAYTYINT